MEPFLSIITPLHNKGRYIAETIRSVQRQAFTDWEMLVVENQSTDDGPAIVREYAAKDTRVILVEAPPEVHGPGAARNLGIQRATGAWIQFLDSDDLLLAGHFESQVAAAKRFSEANIITCDWLEGPGQDEGQCELKRPTNSQAKCHFLDSAIAFTPWVVHAAWVRKCAHGAALCWDPSFDRLVAEDHVFWYQVLQGASIAYSPHTGVYYRTGTDGRRHDKSQVRNYVKTADLAIQANVKMALAQLGILGFWHRRALTVAYLELYEQARQGGDRNLLQLCRENLRHFRPTLRESIAHRALVPLMTYFLPIPVVFKLRQWRMAVS